MDLNDIDLFLAVTEHLSLRRAAEATRLSQPTLSRRIQALEETYGTALFVRHGRGMHLTPAVRARLMPLARHLDAVREEVTAAANTTGGEVSLGFPPSIRILLTHRLIDRFCRAHPNVTVRLTEETSGEVRDLVALGQLDLAITNEFEPVAGLAPQPLAREPLLVVGPREAGLEMTRPISLQELADLPLILTRAPNSLRRLIDSGLGRLGLKPWVRLEANALPLMTDLVELGLGYTVLPSCGVLPALKEGRLSATKLQDFTIRWVVVRARERLLSNAARALLDTIVQDVREAIADGTWVHGFS
ncbi:MAG: LysR family transcriptional regulator [Methylobacteriaceae bacterium]|nr:LysR family transcriptional regulator [Methylobacteriaceae bacterium]